jgi:hypothetical protein
MVNVPVFRAMAGLPRPIDIYSALEFIPKAFAQVSNTSIANCWRHTGILPNTAEWQQLAPRSAATALASTSDSLPAVEEPADLLDADDLAEEAGLATSADVTVESLATEAQRAYERRTAARGDRRTATSDEESSSDDDDDESDASDDQRDDGMASFESARNGYSNKRVYSDREIEAHVVGVREL